MTAQNNIINKGFEELELEFKKEIVKNKELSFTYAATYLKKAKKEKHTLKIAKGYYFYTQLYLDPLSKKGIKYCDSIIEITKNIKENANYPASGYKEKGRFYYRLGEYKLALDNYIIALNYSENNPLMHSTINFNIGLIKNNIGERDEAKEIFKDYLTFLELKQNKKPTRSYNLALFALADYFNYSNQLDSANIYINKGIINSIKTNDNHSYKFFVLGSGINSVFREKYKKAKDSLLKAKKLFSENYDKTSLATVMLYLGKSNLALKEDAMKYFFSVDSILNTTNDVTPELLETYNILIKHYKSKNDYKKHIYYITQLLKFDSILNTNHKYLAKNIVKNYDVKNLIIDKNNTITRLNKGQSISNKVIVILFFLVSIALIVIYYFYRKHKIDVERFQTLLKDYKAKKEEVLVDKEIKEESSIRELPQELINDVLLKLKEFELSNKFTKKKYTLPILAKELNTNGTYLSKIINETKQMNFANYLNQLKIDYSIELMTSNPKFRGYTIKAIAEECGFKTQQSFSAAFSKKTGIKPSFFIKQLENKVDG